jgi:hypothetical protein
VYADYGDRVAKPAWNRAQRRAPDHRQPRRLRELRPGRRGAAARARATADAGSIVYDATTGSRRLLVPAGQLLAASAAPSIEIGGRQIRDGGRWATRIGRWPSSTSTIRR